MDFSDPRCLELFLEVYGGLPRAGPGGDEHTSRALKMVPESEIRTVLDLGCGPGAQTLALARALPEASILALDILPAMVDEASRRIVRAGKDDRVRVEIGDMGAPSAPAASQDLIWCEGAIYFLGVENALRTWRELLTPRGVVGFTESMWLQPSPPVELERWWHAQYPAITDENGVRTAIRHASFETLGFFALPADAWWEEYYAPMEGRLAEFEEHHPGDAVAAEINEMAKVEIDMFRRYSEFYSYGFFITRPIS